MGLAAHVDALVAHTAPGLVDLVLANNRFDARIPTDWTAEIVRLDWPPASVDPAPRLILDDVVDPAQRPPPRPGPAGRGDHPCPRGRIDGPPSRGRPHGMMRMVA